MDVQDSATQICSFRVGSELFGLEVAAIREVIRAQPVTPVPLAEPAILGLTNLRGQIVTVVDLSCRIGMTEPLLGGAEDARVHLILAGKEHPVSLVVDEVLDVVTVDYEQVEPPPVTMGAAREFVTGTATLGGRLLLLLDEDKVAAPRERTD